MSTTQKDKDLKKKRDEESKVEDTKKADTEQVKKPEEKVEPEKKEDAVGSISEDRQSVRSEQVCARKKQWQDLKAKIREEDGSCCGS